MSDTSRGPRRVAPEDIYEIALVSDAQISPDGETVAYVQTVLDREKNDYRSSLYLVPVAGGEPRRFTTADAKDTSPRWSPSGDRIAFLSTRSGSCQVWVISTGGGEARQVTDLPEDVTYFAWSPDGATLALVSKAEAAQLEQREEGSAGDEEEKENSDVVRLTRIRIRSDGQRGFLDDKHAHIWCVPAEGGKPWQVTSGSFDDGRPVWSPDGRWLAFVSNRTPEPDYNNVSQIWVVAARGGDPRPIAAGEDAYFFEPAWSPDGQRIAFVGHRKPASANATNRAVWVAPAGGGEARCLTAELDRTAEDAMLTDTATASDPGLVWSPDGQHLYFPVSDQGNTHLYRVGADGGDAECVVGGRRRVHDFSLSRDGQRVAFVAADPLNPGDVYVCAADGADERRLTRVNEGYLRSVALSEPEEFWVESQAEDRLPIQAWLLRPVGFEEGRKYPVVLEVHGGPHSMYGNVFFHEFQLLAAQGYAVVYANPRGSQGYGDAFTKAAVGAWGERDMPDLMAVLDHVVGMGFVDANRQAVLGGSYGGFMTNWLVGHTDRFRAAITMRCVSNLYSFYGTSDIGFRFGEYEIGGMPWENRDQYLRLSPISYVERMTTPLLILHSEADYRCPIEQAEQLFVMLKRLGREVEFVRFPDESHGLSRNGKPKHRVERLQHILRWFERYL